MSIAFNFFGLFSSPEIFLTAMIIVGGLIGAASGKLTISAFGAFLTYVYIGLDSDLVFFNNLLYLIIVIMLLILGFQSWNWISGVNE